MNKQEGANDIYYVQCDSQPRNMCNVLSSFLVNQTLVDLIICCGVDCMHAHKCVLAANSPYFKEQFEKNAETETIIFNGLDFVIIKTIIEFMYSGQTNISKRNLKYVIAAAKYFQVLHLQNLVPNNEEILKEADQIVMKPPTFLSDKRKYYYSDMSIAVGSEVAKKMRRKYVKCNNKEQQQHDKS